MTVLQKISAGLGLVALLLGVYLLFAQDDSMGIMVIALGLIAIIIAWKVLKGIAKTVALVVILAVAALVVFGGGA